MKRALILWCCLSLTPAAAFDIEKWADDLVKREQASWRNERLGQIQKDRDPKVRAEAARGMSTSDPEELMALGNALSDPDARVRWAAASRLWDAGEKAVPFRLQLTKALDDPDANVVAYAAGALQASGVKEAELAPARKRVIDAPDISVTARFYVARNLVGYESPRKLLDPMLAYLERNTRDGGDGKRQNVELVERALERLVKNTKDRALIPPLWEALVETKNANVQLMKALGYFEPRPDGWTTTLLRQLENPNARVRKEALTQLGNVKQEKEVAVWAPRAGEALKDREVRGEAVWVLGNQGGLAASEIEKIAALASDESPGLRRMVVRSLGEIAEANQAIPAATKAHVTRVARPILEAAQQDADKDVREEAKYALRKLGADDGRSVIASVHSKAPVKASPGSAASEASGMAVLRARKVSFDENSWFRALSEVDVNLVSAFLDAGMSPSAPVANMGPPIRVMLFNNKACSPNVRPTLGETKAIVKILLDRGADIHAADSHGNNALTEAASKGCDRELIRMLIKAGAKVNVGNSSGLTPFEMGLWMGHDGLEELIAAGYRLPPDKAKAYLEGYKDRPAAIAMVKKASAKK